MSNPLVSVVVVSWNGATFLPKCLDALAAQTLSDVEVIVVDNGSHDGSVELVQRKYPSVRLIQNGANLGFAAANNVAIRATSAPLVATLNNDTIVDPHWLERLVDAIESGPRVGSVASKMVQARDPATIDSCGIALDPAAIAWDLYGGFPSSAVDRRHEIFGPCAGAALYRRELLEDVGLFAERFFAYLEDVDLAWRARLRGWRCLLEPRAVVHHAHSGTLGEGSVLKRYLLARNKVWTIARCAPDEDLRERLPIIALYDVGAATFGVARQHDGASVRGRLAGLRGLPEVLYERREVQARRTAPIEELRRWYSPLAPPWEVPGRYRHLVSERRPNPEPATSEERGKTASEAEPRAMALPRASGRTMVRRALLRAAGALLRTPSQPRRSAMPVVMTASEGRRPSLVVLRPDHLGDVLLARPAIELLAKHCRVTVVVGPWGAPSLQGLPIRVATFEYPGFTRRAKPHALAPYISVLAFATRLRSERPDAVVVLRPDHWWGALAAALAGVPVRVGVNHPDVAQFLTHPVDWEVSEHAARTGLRIAECSLSAFGVAASRGECVPTFEPTPAANEAATRWLQGNALVSSALIVVHPGAGAALKSWPPQRWSALVDALGEQGPVVLTGGASEAALLAQIQAHARGQCRVVTELSWDELAALYHRASVVVGMDSGPLHLATAVGTPTVRLFGPTDPAIYGPAGDGQHVMHRSRVPCTPCGNLEAPPCGYLQDPPCLATIRVDDVVASVRALLPTAVTA